MRARARASVTRACCERTRFANARALSGSSHAVSARPAEHRPQVVIHAKLNTGCRCAIGIECVAKRVEISTIALQGLYGELDREMLANDLLKGVAFEAKDACQYPSLDYSHVYLFDRVFSEVRPTAIVCRARDGCTRRTPRIIRWRVDNRTVSVCVCVCAYVCVLEQVTLVAIAKVLQRSSFHVMISSRKPQVWWGCGLSKIQPVAKMRFKTTGREGCTAFIYINSHFIPGI